MKKLFVLIGIAVLTLTILNVSKIDTKATSGTMLASLVTSARASGEDETDCFYQVKDAFYVYYNDPCDFESREIWSCWPGWDECQSGDVSVYTGLFCAIYRDEYLNQVYCPTN